MTDNVQAAFELLAVATLPTSETAPSPHEPYLPALEPPA
jgi:hypothetical protein